MSIIAGIIGSTVSTATPPPPEPNTSLEVRQWLGTYDGGGSNGSFFVRLADYPTAGDIPIGATGVISNDGTPTFVTVVSNILDTAYTESVRILSFDVSDPVIRVGTDATFNWYVAPAPDGSMFIPGTSSRVTLTPGIVVGGTSTTPFTVEGWFYSTVTPGTNSGPVLLSTDTASSNPTYIKALTININTATQIVVDSNGAAQQAFNFAETMLINTWYYVAVSRDSSGNLQAWLGKDGDANATVSTTARLETSGNAAWELTGLSNCVGAFVPANRYTTGYISNLRVDSTGLYATDAATIPVPTAPFTELASTVFLQTTEELTDETGTQTLAAVGSAAGDALNPF